MTALLAQDMLVLFAILAIGTGLGRISVHGISLGPAGVLFVALAFGHFGMKVPAELTELGLLLFVYAVGLEAGPGFFRAFIRHGKEIIMITLVMLGAATAATASVSWAMNIPWAMASGLFAGALTCTPALAAALNSAKHLGPELSAELSMGYGISYPFSIVSVVLIVQFLPRILKQSIAEEEARWKAETAEESPSIHVRYLRVLNANLDNKRLRELISMDMSHSIISRVYRGNCAYAATPEFILRLDDVVTVVGTKAEHEKMMVLLGEYAPAPTATGPSNLLSTDIDVNEHTVTGRTLGELKAWDRFGVVITRIRRCGVEFIPTGRVTLEMGDSVRVVGERTAVEAFEKIVEGSQGKADETNMLPYLLGLVLGILVGSVPITLPNGFVIMLGAAGGAFITSLLIGHFGRIGPFRLHVPQAAKNLTRELGLMLFLAGVGTAAGGRLIGVLQNDGFNVFAGGIAVTTITIAAGILVMNLVYRMNILAIMGTLAGCMTNPPGLASAARITETSLPTVSYASIYPLALIMKIILAQILVAFLPRLAN